MVLEQQRMRRTGVAAAKQEGKHLLTEQLATSQGADEGFVGTWRHRHTGHREQRCQIVVFKILL